MATTRTSNEYRALLRNKSINQEKFPGTARQHQSVKLNDAELEYIIPRKFSVDSAETKAAAKAQVYKLNKLNIVSKRVML